MKTTGLLLIAISIFALAVAVYLHSEPDNEIGRYEIIAASGLSGVYRLDTKTGEVSTCSPLYENGCMTLEETHLRIKKHQKGIQNTAEQAVDKEDVMFTQWVCHVED